MKFETTLHKRNLKMKYIILLDIVSKCLMSTCGSLEQIRKSKLRLVAAIEESPNVDFNWLKFFINTPSVPDQFSKLTFIHIFTSEICINN